jgi:hypothetical protein
MGELPELLVIERLRQPQCDDLTLDRGRLVDDRDPEPLGAEVDEARELDLAGERGERAAIFLRARSGERWSEGEKREERDQSRGKGTKTATRPSPIVTVSSRPLPLRRARTTAVNA